MAGDGVPAQLGIGPGGWGVGSSEAGGCRSGADFTVVLGVDPEKGGGRCVRCSRRLDGKGGMALGKGWDDHYVSPSDDGADG